MHNTHRSIPSIATLVVLAAFSLSFTSATVAKPAKPAKDPLAEYIALGASEDLARCAAHAVASTSTKAHGAFKRFIFDEATFKKARTEEWGAPFVAGESKRITTMVSFFGKAELKTGGGEKLVHVKCGLNGKQVDGFAARDTSVPIKIKS